MVRHLKGGSSMVYQSSVCFEILSKTVNINDEIAKKIRKQLIYSDDKKLMFNNEEVKSPGQLGIKIMQLINEAIEESKNNSPSLYD